MAFPSKLTDKQRQHIIATSDQNNAPKLAAKYGVATGTIYAVRKKYARQLANNPSMATLKQEYPKDRTPEEVAAYRAEKRRQLLTAIRPYLNGTVFDGDCAVIRIPVGELLS